MKDDVLSLMLRRQPLCGHLVMMLWTDLGVDDFHPVGDLPDGDNVDGHTKDEVVVALWKALLIEQEIEKELDHSENHIEGYGVVS